MAISPTPTEARSVPCEHPILYVESYDDLGIHTSCLLCGASKRMPLEDPNWIAFESQEAPSWDASRLHLERDTLLVRRELIS